MCISFLYGIGSCSSHANDDECAALYVQRISANLGNNDSINALCEEISQTCDDDTRRLINVIASDSPVEVHAVAMVATLLPDAVADSIIVHPSRSLITLLAETYVRLGQNENLDGLQTALKQRFEKMSISEKARFVTSVASPQECAQNIEAGDEKLIDEIRLQYAGAPSKLREFNRQLANNRNINI
ncbi:MAG: hypothetical protein Q4F07_09135 [Bacteroidales bacterium]|nr:hypothetical protein [Bacteroidales bacterium]